LSQENPLGKFLLSSLVPLPLPSTGKVVVFTRLQFESPPCSTTIHLMCMGPRTPLALSLSIPLTYTSSMLVAAPSCLPSILCLENGHYVEAVIVLLSLGMCSSLEKAIVAIMENHLTALSQVLPEDPQPPPLVLRAEVVRGMLLSFQIGSIVGGFSFKVQYLRDMVECPNMYVSSKS